MAGFPDFKKVPKSDPGPYSARLRGAITALLQLFQGRVPDPETHSCVSELARRPELWPKAHDVFDQVRPRLVGAMEARDPIRCDQYNFEEMCLKAMYNATYPAAPFDADSPFHVVGCALALARRIGLPLESVINIVAPKE